MLFESLDSTIKKCMDSYACGKYKTAEKLCRHILKKQPQNKNMELTLGNIYFLQKKYDEALKIYQNLWQKDKDSFALNINLANVFLEKKDYTAAEKFAEIALRQDSQNEQCIQILGLSLLEQNKPQKAIKIFAEAISNKTKNAWIYNYISQCYQQMGATKEALAAGFKAVELSPEDDNQHINFGYMLYELALDSDDEKIKKYAQIWQEKFPENKIAEHMGNALLKKQENGKINVEYIQEIFDIFADDFEEVLAGLEYKTPQKIGRFLSEIYADSHKKKLKILDAGCGTGLCGKYLKPYAGFFSLSGVDISSKMLDSAKKKKLYNHLCCDELVHFLSCKKNSYDLIVSADVLTYFSSLDSLFLNVHNSLKRNGKFVFSISANDEDETDFVLHISGRYKHHINYIKSLAKKYGFDIEKTEKHILRKEGGKGVNGYIISLIRQ